MIKIKLKSTAFYMLTAALLISSISQSNLYGMRKKICRSVSSRLSTAMASLPKTSTTGQPISPLMLSRNIVSIADLKGTHKPFYDSNKTYLSPVCAASLTHGSLLNSLRVIKQRIQKKSQNYSQGTATIKLINDLFSPTNSKVVPNSDKSSPVYSLDAELIAQIISHLENGTLNDQNYIRLLSKHYQSS